MTSTYVSVEYLTQVSRIRYYLQKYRNNFLSLSYIDGTGHIVDSAYDIWVNLCLITSKVRPAFLIQWTDYINPTIYDKIMKLLINYRDDLDYRDIDYRLLFLTDPRGIIVTTYYSYYKVGFVLDSRIITVRELYARYLLSNRHDLNILDNILGYPTTGKYLSKDNPNSNIYSIYVTVSGSNALPILTNIYYTNTINKEPNQTNDVFTPSMYIEDMSSKDEHSFNISNINKISNEKSRILLNDLYLKISETVKLYDLDAKITIFDSQPIDDIRISSDNYHIEFTNKEKAKVTKYDKTIYEEFIKSTDRTNENWNTEFDKIFELGYIYNR